MYRVKIEVPADANKLVVNALRLAADSLGVTPSVMTDAPPDSYSLTIHTFPDKEEKE